MPAQFNGSEADMVDASFSRCPIKPKLLGPVGKPTCKSPYEGGVTPESPGCMFILQLAATIV